MRSFKQEIYVKEEWVRGIIFSRKRRRARRKQCPCGGALKRKGGSQKGLVQQIQDDDSVCFSKACLFFQGRPLQWKPRYPRSLGALGPSFYAVSQGGSASACVVVGEVGGEEVIIIFGLFPPTQLPCRIGIDAPFSSLNNANVPPHKKTEHMESTRQDLAETVSACSVGREASNRKHHIPSSIDV